VRSTVAVVSIAVDELATQLYVDPGGVRVILATRRDEPIADTVSNQPDRGPVERLRRRPRLLGPGAARSKTVSVSSGHVSSS
jgi:hypothetical protein